MAETGEVDGSNITGITEVGTAVVSLPISFYLTISKISKSTALGHPASSPSRWRRTSHRSQWWTIPVLQQRLVVLGVVEGPSSVVAEEVVVTNVVEGAHSNGSVAAAVSKVTITTIEGEEVDVGEDLAGKIMTSHKGIETLQSISNLTGRCSRKLISTVWPS